MSNKTTDVYEGIQWTIGQLFPELIHPGHIIAQNFKTPTVTATLMFNTTLRVQGAVGKTMEGDEIETPNRRGTAWAYFAPYNDLLIMRNINNMSEETVQKNAAFFSSSAGPAPENDIKEFHWNEIAQNDGNKSDATVSTYKKLRINSAAIVIKQLAPLKDYSGILKVGMGYKGMIQGMNSFKFSDFDKHFTMTKTINLAKESDLVIRYRLPFNQYNNFGPYDPTTPVPYFFMLAEGVPPDSSFDITVIRHIEGVPKTIYRHFVPQHQAPFHTVNEDTQKEVIDIFAKEATAFESYIRETPKDSKPNKAPSENMKDLSTVIENNFEYKMKVKNIIDRFGTLFGSNLLKYDVDHVLMTAKSKLHMLKEIAPKLDINENFAIAAELYDPRLSAVDNINKWAKAVTNNTKNKESFSDIHMKHIEDFLLAV